MIEHWYHVYADGNWHEPVCDHYQSLIESDMDGCLHISAVGSPAGCAEIEDFFGTKRDDEFDFEFYESRNDHWEQTTLNLLRGDLVPDYLDDDDIVFYAHSKGSAHASTWNTTWRNTMRHFAFTHWREMTAPLLANQADVSSIWWISEAYNPRPHPQGNYWFARVDYLRTLPPPSLEDRFGAEWWVGQNRPRVYDPYPGSAGGSLHWEHEGFECPLCP